MTPESRRVRQLMDRVTRTLEKAFAEVEVDVQELTHILDITQNEGGLPEREWYQLRDTLSSLRKARSKLSTCLEDV